MSTIEEQLKNISELKDGWLDGQGRQINQSVIDITRQILALICWTNINHYVVFPSEAGGIVIEADNLGWDIYVDINPRIKMEVSAFKKKDKAPPYIKDCNTVNEVNIALNEILSFQ